MEIKKQELEKLNSMVDNTVDEVTAELKKVSSENEQLRKDNQLLLEKNVKLRRDVTNLITTPEIKEKPKKKMETWRDFLQHQSEVKQIWR